MDIKKLQQNWDTMGKHDAMWAILTQDDKSGNRWNESEFFQTGVNDFKRVMENDQRCNIVLSQNKALDFGCGIGRLTQPLCTYFNSAAGVDIAPSMIEQARLHNSYGDKCTYYLNEKDDLSIFKNGEFDFIYSLIVLQHMHPRFSRNYIKEFIRLLSPEGIAYFQLPAKYLGQKKKGLKHLLKEVVKKILPVSIYAMLNRNSATGGANMELYGTPKEELISFIKQNGGKVVQVLEDKSAGELWESYVYMVSRA